MIALTKKWAVMFSSLAAGKEHGGEEIGAMHESCLPQTTRQEYRPEVEEISKDTQTQTLAKHKKTQTQTVLS